MVASIPTISGKELTPKNKRLRTGLEHRLNRWCQEQSNRMGDAIKGKYKLGRKAKKVDSDPEGDDLQTELLVGGKKIPKIQSDMIRAIALLGWRAIDWKALVEIMEPYLAETGKEGVDVGVGQVQMVNAAKAQEEADAEAEAYATARAAELGGKKWVEVPKDTADAIERDGKHFVLEDDPEAHWPLTTVMDRDLNATVMQAVTEGWTAEQLSAVLDATYALSAERMAVVADTEITNAQGNGTYSLWRTSGAVTLVRWRTRGLERAPDECDDYEDQGVVPLGHEFAEGLFSPKAHPFCNCELEAVDPNDVFDGAES